MWWDIQNEAREILKNFIYDFQHRYSLQARVLIFASFIGLLLVCLFMALTINRSPSEIAAVSTVTPVPLPTYTPLSTYTPLPTYTPFPTYTPLPSYTPVSAYTPTSRTTTTADSTPAPNISLPTPVIAPPVWEAPIWQVPNELMEFTSGNMELWQQLLPLGAGLVALLGALGFNPKGVGVYLKWLLRKLTLWGVGGATSGFLLWTIMEWERPVTTNWQELIGVAAIHTLIVGSFASLLETIVKIDKKGASGMIAGMLYGAINILLTGVGANNEAVIIILFWGSIGLGIGYVVDNLLD